LKVENIEGDAMTHRSAALPAAIVFPAILLLAMSPINQVAAADSQYIQTDHLVRVSDNNLPTKTRAGTYAGGSGTTHVRGLGTFSGNIAAKRFKGNGIYFSIEGDEQTIPAKAKPHPGPKIIDVDDAQPTMECDENTDICIIRP
tara:strand:+ start:43404 stop:43835 length:432 start_codon:yes stop_codon:yes gene_type:complete